MFTNLAPMFVICRVRKQHCNFVASHLTDYSMNRGKQLDYSGKTFILD